MSRAGNFTLVFIALSGITLLAASLGMLSSGSWQLLLLALMVVLTGLPHGAMDPLIAREAGLIHGYSGLIRFGLIYLLQAMATLMAWLLVPFFALPMFLAMSAWHFSSDWKSVLPDWFRTLAGASIILAPILFWQPEVTRLFAVLSDAAIAQRLVSLLELPAALTLVTIAAAVVYYRTRLGWAGLEVVIVIVLAWALPPLVFFTLYFCGLHSPRHAADVIRHYGIKPREALLVSGLFTLIAVVFASAFFISGESGSVDDKSIRIIFIGLAALTVPHMILLAKVGKAEKSR